MIHADVFDRLTHLRPVLAKNHYISRLAVFGSTARGENTENSDIDLLIDFDPDAPPIGLFRFAQIRREISEYLDRPVDLGMFAALKQPKHDSILDDIRDV